MERVMEDSVVWIPNVEEFLVIDILSNLGDYLMPRGYVGPVVDTSGDVHADSMIPLRAGLYCELRNSRVLPRIISPSWKRKNITPSIPRKVRTVSNPYTGAVGDGKMYVTLLPKPLVSSPMPTSTV